MNSDAMVRWLQNSLSDFFECSEMPGGSVRVRTPLTHPDGTLVDLFLIPGDDRKVEVSDSGDTTGWLRTQSAGGLTASQNGQISRLCRNLNVQKSQGRITVVARDRQTLGESVARVAQAAVLITHIASK